MLSYRLTKNLCPPSLSVMVPMFLPRALHKFITLSKPVLLNITTSLAAPSEEYHITIQDQDSNETYSVTLPSVTNWLHLYDQAQPSWPMFHSCFYHDGKVCVFKNQSYSNHLSETIEKHTQEVLVQMREQQTEILILDLRGNGGGNAGLGTPIIRRVIGPRICS